MEDIFISFSDKALFVFVYAILLGSDNYNSGLPLVSVPPGLEHAPYLCLSFFVHSNMLSQSLKFAFPCRNSFFIRSSVECSPLELSSQ